MCFKPNTKMQILANGALKFRKCLGNNSKQGWLVNNKQQQLTAYMESTGKNRKSTEF
jgi:hypothetical protein